MDVFFEYSDDEQVAIDFSRGKRADAEVDLEQDNEDQMDSREVMQLFSSVR